MKRNNYAMKDWHLEHVEKVIIRFAEGLSPDASSFEKRNYKKYGTIAYCIKQIEYDMKQGVEKIEVMEILHKIKLHKKHAKIRPNAEAAPRLGIRRHAFLHQKNRTGASLARKCLS